MPRRITLSVLAAVLTAAVAGFIASTGGASAAAKKPAGFRQVLATRLGSELHKSPTEVVTALKAANQAAKADKIDKSTPGQKLSKGDRAKRLAQAESKRADWTAAFAKSLGVDQSAVKSAVDKLVKQRLDSLVADGWLTADQAAKREGRLGIGFLRAGVR